MNAATSSRLLVACLSDEQQPMLLARARALAEAAQLDIYVYRPVQDPGREIALSPNPKTTADSRHEQLQHAEQHHRSMIEWLSDQGLSVDGRIEWQPSPVAATLDLIDDLVPQFVMLGPKDEYSRTARLLLSHDDFELIRRCPAPVWLARRYPETGGTIFAAVDPMHSDDGACSVDHAILRMALSLAPKLGHRTHMIHSYTAPGLIDRLSEALRRGGETVRDAQRIENAHVERVHALARDHEIDVSHVHIGNDDLIEVIESLIDPMNVDLIVLGALSRSRLRRMLIGGTAEKLLRSVDADLLVIKPPSDGRMTPE